jgi:hypothetical protein
VTDNQPVTVDLVIEQLGERVSDAKSTVELLEGYRKQIGHVIASCERIAADIAEGITRPHIAELRQLASNASVEQRRCLMFRDKVINRPLPHERMRPLLNDISVTTRDQLTAFRDLGAAASRLESLLPPSPAPEPPGRGFDRRALFTRIFRLPDKDA